MKKTIAVLRGDGVGSEIVAQSLRVLDKISERFSHEFIYTEGLIGAVAIEEMGNPFPEETEKLCLDSDAVLFGAIGDPKYDNDPSAKVRPEQGLLAMRKALGLYANVRPIFTFPSLVSASPLKEEVVKGVDFVVIRELIGGVYYGKRGRSEDRMSAFDTNEYSREEIARVVRFGFELVRKRISDRLNPPTPFAKGGILRGANEQCKLTMVDKANVLETSRLWRETVQGMMGDYPDVEVEFMFVDNAAMQIIKRPSAFNVIVTENMFGDILTDEASVITGSLGMLPSASIGEKTSLYEPIHGSYPKAAGKNVANPIAGILSAAMMLEYSFGLKEERDAIFGAVERALEEGYGTRDIVKENPILTSELTNAILRFL